MARSADVIQSEIDSLQHSLSRGVLSVRHGDTQTQYADANQIIAAIKSLQAELSRASTSPLRQVRFQTSKGL